MSAPYEQQPYGQSPGTSAGPGYPSGAPAAGPAPTPVRRAVLLGWVRVALSIIGLVVSAVSIHSADTTTTVNGGAVDADTFKAIGVAGAVVGGLIAAALWAVFTHFTSKGRGWARVVMIVLAALSGLFQLLGLIHFTAADVLGLVQLVTGVLIIVWLASKPASAWFAAQKGQRTGYGTGYAAGGPQDPSYPPVPPVQ